MQSTGMIKRRQCKLDVHSQVLWHTAAAFSETLLQAAQLPGEKLSEQTAELAAERLRRQQQAIPVPAQVEANAGHSLSHAIEALSLPCQPASSLCYQVSLADSMLLQPSDAARSEAYYRAHSKSMT